jgi:hypothetical protein
MVGEDGHRTYEANSATERGSDACRACPDSRARVGTRRTYRSGLKKKQIGNQ